MDMFIYFYVRTKFVCSKKQKYASSSQTPPVICLTIFASVCLWCRQRQFCSIMV